MKSSIEEKKKFASIMRGLAGNFGGKIKNDDLALRFKTLNEYSIEDISKGCYSLLRKREATFPAIPTTEEIINAIKLCTNPEPDKKTIAENELDIVMKYFNYYGSACEYKFKNSITNFLIKNRWTFRQIGMMGANDLKWFKKEFVEAHIRYTENKEVKAISFDGDGIQISSIKKLSKLTAGLIKGF